MQNLPNLKRGLALVLEINRSQLKICCCLSLLKKLLPVTSPVAPKKCTLIACLLLPYNMFRLFILVPARKKMNTE